MNEKQITALWITIILILVTLTKGWGLISLEENQTAQFTIGSIILGVAIIFTLKANSQFEKGFLVKLTIVSLLFALAFFTYNYYQSVLSIQVLPKLEKDKITLEKSPSSYADGNIYVDIYNGSKYQVTKLILKVSTTPLDKSISFEEFLNNSSYKDYKIETLIEPMSSGLIHIKAIDIKNTKVHLELVSAYGRN